MRLAGGHVHTSATWQCFFHVATARPDGSQVLRRDFPRRRAIGPRFPEGVVKQASGRVTHAASHQRWHAWIPLPGSYGLVSNPHHMVAH